MVAEEGFSALKEKQRVRQKTTDDGSKRRCLRDGIQPIWIANAK
jgi:hypothetical protein